MAISRISHVLVWLGYLIIKVFGQDNYPDTEDFLRAGLWGGTVIGKYIYLDGGEVSRESGGRTYEPINATLSIDCTKSWSPQDVEIREIDKDAPVRSRQAVITDQSTNSFYIWDGYSPYQGPAINDSDLWRFTADGEGGGDWGREPVTNGDVWGDFVRTLGTAYTSSNDMGFQFGGTFVGGGPVKNAKGFKTLNFTTMEWEEETDVPYPDATLYGGSAIFVEKYGASGTVVVLGGLTNRDGSGSGYLSVDRAYLYDIAAKQWHYQDVSSTGSEKPARWDRACAVGVADTGDTDSFEIFVYGGGNSDEGGDSGTIYALSLPGFFWTKVHEDPDRRRSDHVCVTLGNNQLVSLGGLIYAGETEDNWGSKDLFPRGIGIFNMNNYSWQDSFDADADEYVTHESIRTWYEDGGMDSMDWSSQEVRALFVQEDESSPTPVGAIVGGVVGGVAGIAIIGAAFWLFLRKRSHSHETSTAQEEDIEILARPPTHPPSEVPAEAKFPSDFSKSPASELADERRTPLGSSTHGPPTELQG